jgi:hypothetical protein
MATILTGQCHQKMCARYAHRHIRPKLSEGNKYTYTQVSSQEESIQSATGSTGCRAGHPCPPFPLL